MRNYAHIDHYLDLLAEDIYPQPPDPGHQAGIEEVIDNWLPKIHRPAGVPPFTILDVGCAQGQAIPVLLKYAPVVVGVTLGTDAEIARRNGFDVHAADISFLPFDNNMFDLVFARHVIEHSPMPLLTLMEWNRVSKNYLLMVVPAYAHYRALGQNHYYVLLFEQWEYLLDRAGWPVVWTDRSKELVNPFEIRWLCQKVER